MNEIDYTERSLKEQSIEDIISTLSDDTIISCIKDQINNIHKFSDDTRIEYFKMLDTKFKVVKEEYKDIPSILVKINDLQTDIYNDIIIQLGNTFGFNINSPHYFSEEEMHEYYFSIYEFFINRYKEHCYTIIKEFIKNNALSLYRSLRNGMNKKSLIYSNLSSKFSESSVSKIEVKKAIVIVYYLQDIINSITYEEPIDYIKIITSLDKEELVNKDILKLSELNILDYNEKFIDNILKDIKDNTKIYIDIKAEIINYIINN